jgi:hypothetical protein
MIRFWRWLCALIRPARGAEEARLPYDWHARDAAARFASRAAESGIGGPPPFG